MILFKKLRWKNFISTGNLFTEIDLCKSSTTLIVGENGAGKSTILDALTFALFGKAFRKINKPQLLNSITRKDLCVEIEFDIGSNQYKIIRGIKPTIFEVYCNGQLANQSAESKDYQEILEKQILKLNIKSFCQVVVLGSATFQPFMQLSAAQRREIIEDLLDLQVFTTMNLLLKNRMVDNTNLLTDIAADQKVVTEKIKIVKQHLLERQTNNEKLVAEKISIIDDTDNKISDLTDQYHTISNQIDDLNVSIEDEPKVSKRINQLSQLRHKIEAKRALLDNDVNFFKKHENCPTCTQSISDDFRERTLASKNNEIENIDTALVDLVKQYEDTNQRLNEMVEVHMNINSLQMKQATHSSNIKSLVAYRNQLEKDINNINSSYETDEDNKTDQLEQELNDVAIRYNDAMDQKQIYTAASMMLKDGGIKARIIKQYVPVINKLINKYLSAMDFFVQFELDEEFNETIKSRFRDDFSYASFSEGEKMRINLAILFTWRAVAKLRNSVSTNLLIMDEVMDSSLDSNGTEEFMKILFDLVQDTNTFIISHKTDQFYDKFGYVIRFEKKQNFSKVA